MSLVPFVSNFTSRKKNPSNLRICAFLNSRKLLHNSSGIRLIQTYLNFQWNFFGKFTDQQLPNQPFLYHLKQIQNHVAARRHFRFLADSNHEGSGKDARTSWVLHRAAEVSRLQSSWTCQHPDGAKQRISSRLLLRQPLADGADCHRNLLGHRKPDLQHLSMVIPGNHWRTNKANETKNFRFWFSFGRFERVSRTFTFSHFELLAKSWAAVIYVSWDQNSNHPDSSHQRVPLEINHRGHGGTR